MKNIIIAAFSLACLCSLFSCKDDETYAEMKEKEKNAIKHFINDNDIVGKITVISEKEFLANDSTTDVSKNEFVLFEDDGIYMQIVKQGEGMTMREMARTQSADSTVSKTILCRFFEYDIEGADTVISNIFTARPDKMLCKYVDRGRSYTASFIEGYMLNNYSSSVVPKGWMKPLTYLRLSRNESKKAKVRLIVPHSSGTSHASNYVLPMFYEISYQLGI